MTMSFNTIPSNTLVPIFYAEMDNSAANTAQDSGASLLIGHANNGAEIVANSLVLMPSADYARQICGAGSQLARMVEAYRQTDPFGELYVIAVPESTGAAATVTLTVTGAATETGTVNVYVGRTRVQAPVTNGDNVATIASSIKDAINAVPTLPFTASSSAGVVTLTARHKGLCGNEIPVSLNYYGFGGGEVLPAGVQIAVATGITSSTLPWRGTKKRPRRLPTSWRQAVPPAQRCLFATIRHVPRRPVSWWVCCLRRRGNGSR